MVKNVPKKRRCPPATTTAGTSQTKTQTGRQTSATNALPHSTRQPAIRSTVPLYDFADLLDLTGTLSASAANTLAAIARLLAEHDREIGGLGADVALVARMTTQAAHAASLLESVAIEYQRWMEVEA